VNSVVLCILIPFLYIIFILFVSDFRGRDNSNQLFFSKETLCFFSSGVSPSKKNSPKLQQFSLSLSLSRCFEHLCSTELSSKKKKRCEFLFLFMNLCIIFQETGMRILDPAHKFECGITFASEVHFWPSSHVPLEFLINSGFMV